MAAVLERELPAMFLNAVGQQRRNYQNVSNAKINNKRMDKMDKLEAPKIPKVYNGVDLRDGTQFFSNAEWAKLPSHIQKAIPEESKKATGDQQKQESKIRYPLNCRRINPW